MWNGLLLVFGGAVSQGCSLFVGSTQPVIITASDPSAQIIVNGQVVGTGTATVQLRRNRPHSVMAKVGDRAAAAAIGTQISTTGILDIIGGAIFLVPFFGVLGAGFWSLDQESVVLALPPGA
ncbi:MAG: hypothetical protein L0323_22635 [Planctomycetes bacterium]|nr:hypothetical protein [Planctomycetota bacterium]